MTSMITSSEQKYSVRKRNPPRRVVNLSIAIPASLVSDIPNLREKTSRIGLIGRALAIFRVDEIIIYSDRLDADQSRDMRLITTILSYMETPQYLRKILFKIRPELRYAGVLPPLRTPHHPLPNRIKDLKVGEYREGVVVSILEEGSLVEIGVERPILVPNVQLPLNERVPVKVTKIGKHPKAILINRDEIDIYWGYKVTALPTPLGQIMKLLNFDLIVATSRYGIDFMSVCSELIEKWESSKRVLVAFGSPTRGLYEIMEQENIKLDEIAHFVINTVPNQATETVRTEEALYSTLSILNLYTR